MRHCLLVVAGVVGFSVALLSQQQAWPPASGHSLWSCGRTARLALSPILPPR